MCKDLYEEVLARSWRDPRYAIVHRLVLNAYALQHPRSHCRSARSLAAHLTGLCLACEHEASPDVESSLHEWLNGLTAIKKLKAPRFAESKLLRMSIRRSVRKNMLVVSKTGLVAFGTHGRSITRPRASGLSAVIAI
jgi:hypothetical protein